MTGVYQLPRWIVIWSVFTAIICFWDATFIIMRPHSLPGGKYHALWKIYEMYIEYDKAYADMDNTFVYSQSLLNFVEVFLNLLSVYLNSQCSRYTIGVTFTVAVMTFWKTALYSLTTLPLCGAGECSLQVDLTQVILYVTLPAMIWVVVPFLTMMSLWNRLFHPDTSQKLK